MRKKPDSQAARNGRGGEVAALLAAAHAVLENRAFADAASAILVAWKAIVGAGAGFVAVRGPRGKGLEIAALDPECFELDAAGKLPAPLRRRIARVAKEGRTVLVNDLPKAGGSEPARGRDAGPESVLLAPILAAGEVTGVIGLIDKPAGFSAFDSRLAEVFAEMSAVAMLNSRTVNGLERNRKALKVELREGAAQLRQAEEQFRTLVESLPDIISRYDPELRLLYVSSAIERVTGRPAAEFVGKTPQELGIHFEASELWEATLRRVFATGLPERLEVEFPSPDGPRYFDCRLVPEPAPAGGTRTVLSIARDVTERWLAFEAERNARAVADALREATVVLTRSLDRESVLVTLLDRLRQMVPFDRGRVLLVEDASRLFVRAVFDGDRAMPLPAESRQEILATEHPIVRVILATGAPVLIPDVSAHPDWSLPRERPPEASWMGVPLFARGNVAGLFALSRREADYFREEHVKLAEALSSQASVAVENAVLFEQMQASGLRMRALSRRLVEVQESERRHIALELHDEAGQALVSLRLGLRLLERQIAEGGDVAGRVAELVETTDGILDGLHRLAADLRPASLDHLGLDTALRQHTQSVAAKSGLPVHYKARGFTSERLHQQVETGLYRVVQEAMTNVVRHARATRIDVLVERREDRVLVVVEDDGAGFDPALLQSGDHLGLLGMRERADALGGTMTVESAPGKGTTIVVEVPGADPDPDR